MTFEFFIRQGRQERKEKLLYLDSLRPLRLCGEIS